MADSPNTFQNIIGNIEKARIEIIDARGRDTKRQPPVKVVGGKMLSAVPTLKLNDTALAKAGQTGLLGSLGQVAKTTMANGNYIRGASKKTYIVQFNPSSLTLRARGPGFVPILAYDENGKTVSPTEQSVRITVSVQLIFDQVDPYSAFMEDKLNMSPTALGTNIAKGVMTANGQKMATVQQTVEGFVAALRSPYTRTITFTWGALAYAGVLNSVSAQYTMFDIEGQAIRASMNLSLLCVQDNLVPGSLGPWEDAYEKAFGGDSFDTVRGTQTAGNWLNLG